MLLLQSVDLVNIIQFQIVFDIVYDGIDFLAFQMLLEYFQNRNVHLLIMEQLSFAMNLVQHHLGYFDLHIVHFVIGHLIPRF